MSMQITELKLEDEQGAAGNAKLWLERSLQSGGSALKDWMEASVKPKESLQGAEGFLGPFEYISGELPEQWAELPDLTLKLRAECGKLSQSQHIGLMGRILRRNPLKHYVNAYHKVRCSIDGTVTQLREEREKLETGVMDIRRLNEAAREEIGRLQTGIAFGRNLLQICESELERPDSPLQRGAVEHEYGRTAARIQLLEETAALLRRVNAAAEQIEADEERLLDSVNNVIDRTSGLVTLSAMIAMSLADRESGHWVPEAASGAVIENARLLAGVPERAEELLAKPAASLEAANRAISELLAAIDAAGRSCFQILTDRRGDKEEVAEICRELRRLGGTEPATEEV
ncbi:toxic anion resistance protein [Paenibacillus tepidiphilus]|uniref:toxic anion resistance protein n=1 Tax=Paenibacillus tepidiphilus TaxID=2608683 RepID=UPI00123B31C7|nr:hypothetical protein [Paenibacillus tepidiphilus]